MTFYHVTSPRMRSFLNAEYASVFKPSEVLRLIHMADRAFQKDEQNQNITYDVLNARDEALQHAWDNSGEDRYQMNRYEVQKALRDFFSV